MKLSRRRFLAVSAVSVATAGLVWRQKPLRWSGFALGADVSIELSGGNPKDAKLALDAAIDTIKRTEKLFSLYDANSSISRLNREGTIVAEPEFLRLYSIVSEAHSLTGGLFDPTVQSLFAAKRDGRSVVPADYARVGWQHVHIDGSRVWFDQPKMAVTFNGIAQGFATDRVAEILSGHGFDATLVNVGEYRAGTRIAEIGVPSLGGGIETVVPLLRSAIATSSSDAYLFADMTSHILHPRPLAKRSPWKQATVVAGTAAMADAFSTALILTGDDALAHALIGSHALQIFLQDDEFNLLQV